MVNKVSLEIAWTWVCPSCNLRNFCTSEEIDPKEVEGLELPEGDIVTQPTSVLCTGCMSYYETADDQIEEDDPPPPA